MKTNIPRAKVQRIPLTAVIVPDYRQRSAIDVTELMRSLETNGQLQPIVVTKEGETFTLRAGERRFTAARELGWSHIAAVLTEDLSPARALEVEFTENEHRVNLAWQDRAQALVRLITELESENSWSRTQSREYVCSTGMSSATLDVLLQCGNALAEAPADSPLWTIKQLTEGAKYIRKQRERLHNRVAAELLNTDLDQYTTGNLEAKAVQESGESIAPELSPQTETAAPAKSMPPAAPPLPPIIQADFSEWVETYTGPPFSFIHCDFPYGVKQHKSTQGATDKWKKYEDGADVYWQLLDTLLENLDKIAAAQSHIFFWLSNNPHTISATIKRMEAADLRVTEVPCIWHRSDNAGILPDASREPRRVYETALIASRGDRKIIKAVSNHYSAPSMRESRIHQSEKPVSVLKHFFQMFLGEFDSMLDPTAGSASAARAALQFPVERVLCLEREADFVKEAQAEWISEWHRVQYAKRSLG